MICASNSIGTTFKGNTTITKFSELKYFIGVHKIEDSAFSGCSNLKQIDLSICTYIGGNAFQNCSSLFNIVTLDKIEHIGMYSTFGNTTSLCLDLNLPNLEYMGGSFSGSGITNILSLGKITSIIWTASFTSCLNLKTAILPSTLTEIGSNLFANNKNLQWVKIMSISVPTMDNSSAFNSSGIQYPIYVPDESVDAYKSATNWSSYASRIKSLSTFTQ